jgi:tripeptidyl-peptidase-1
MKLSLFAVIGSLLAQASAAPAPGPYVVHERRDAQTTKWSRSNVKLPRDVIVPMSIGLTQRNLEDGYEFLMEVSHPESPNYGKHWSPQKVSRTPSTFCIYAAEAN